MMGGMSERRTQPTDTSVEEVIDRAGDERRRDDAREVLDLMREVTGAEPVVWGSSMIQSARGAPWLLVARAVSASQSAATPSASIVHALAGTTG